MKHALCVSIGLVALFFAVGNLVVGEAPWTEIPPAQWKGVTAAEVPTLKRRAAAAIALPDKEAKPLTASTVAAQSPWGSRTLISRGHP